MRASVFGTIDSASSLHKIDHKSPLQDVLKYRNLNYPTAEREIPDVGDLAKKYLIIALKTAIYMFKSITEQVDPNISIAKRITNFANTIKKTSLIIARRAAFAAEIIHNIATIASKDSSLPLQKQKEAAEDAKKTAADIKKAQEIIKKIQKFPDIPVFPTSLGLLWAPIWPTLTLGVPYLFIDAAEFAVNVYNWYDEEFSGDEEKKKVGITAKAAKQNAQARLLDCPPSLGQEED